MMFSNEAINLLISINTEPKVRLSVQVSNELKKAIIDMANTKKIKPSLYVRSVLVKELELANGGVIK
jgi:hypothetical protein